MILHFITDSFNLLMMEASTNVLGLSHWPTQTYVGYVLGYMNNRCLTTCSSLYIKPNLHMINTARCGYYTQCYGTTRCSTQTDTANIQTWSQAALKLQLERGKVVLPWLFTNIRAPRQFLDFKGHHGNVKKSLRAPRQFWKMLIIKKTLKK